MGRSARGPYDNVTNLLIGNLYEGNRTKVRKVGNVISDLAAINYFYLDKHIYKSLHYATCLAVKYEIPKHVSF